MASGAANWATFFSAWRVRLTNGWSQGTGSNVRIWSCIDFLLVFAGFMQNAGLKSSILKNSLFTMYQVQGTNPYFGNWTITRHIGSEFPANPPERQSASFYSTEDVYLQHPHEWWAGAGPDHGIQWTQQTRKSEIAAGDVPFSPFVSAGWSGKAEENLRPSQYLGGLAIV